MCNSIAKIDVNFGVDLFGGPGPRPGFPLLGEGRFFKVPNYRDETLLFEDMGFKTFLWHLKNISFYE